MTATSSILRDAVSATVYFKRDLRRGGGEWATTILTEELSDTRYHMTERQAREYVGLSGGSPDPAYRPPAGQTGWAQSVEPEVREAAVA